MLLTTLTFGSENMETKTGWLLGSLLDLSS